MAVLQGYSIQDVSKMTNIPASTLRYYDKEGLLPNLARQSSGYRLFQDCDLEMLHILQCLKSSGMTIQDMKQYIVWMQEGDSTLELRLQLFRERRAQLLAQMKALQDTLDVLDYKCDFYEKAVALGRLPQSGPAPHLDRFLNQG